MEGKGPLGIRSGKECKGQQEGEYKYISGKRKTGENVSPLLNGAGALMTNDTEEAQGFFCFSIYC